ncbi:MAG: hypothetical protein U5L95_02185 [Candidatus Saccharibacteria bacterium]|nr:hypothetical protein [Candidatus Saccharibacteria bacterium]
MGLFNRKKSTDNDINSYYTSERRQRVGMAWALGIATLILTVLLALGLFYGGRWTYRTVFDDDETTTSETATEEDQTDDQTTPGVNDDEQDENNDQSDDQADQGADDSGFEDIVGSDTDETSSDTDETGSATGGSSDRDSSQPSGEELSSTGSQGLPSTGPEDTLGVFVIVSVAFGLGHKAYHVKKASR